MIRGFIAGVIASILIAFIGAYVRSEDATGECAVDDLKLQRRLSTYRGHRNSVRPNRAIAG